MVIDNFIKFGWTVPLKSKKAQTITNSFEIFLITSKRKQNLIEADHGWDIVSKIFTDLLDKNCIKRYSRDISLGVVLAERFNRTIRDPLKRPVFEKGDGNWIDVLSVVTKRYNIRVHTPTKKTPTQDSFKKESLMLKNLLDKKGNQSFK